MPLKKEKPEEPFRRAGTNRKERKWTLKREKLEEPTRKGSVKGKRERKGYL